MSASPRPDRASRQADKRGVFHHLPDSRVITYTFGHTKTHQVELLCEALAGYAAYLHSHRREVHRSKRCRLLGREILKAGKPWRIYFTTAEWRDYISPALRLGGLTPEPGSRQARMLALYQTMLRRIGYPTTDTNTEQE